MSAPELFPLEDGHLRQETCVFKSGSDADSLPPKPGRLNDPALPLHMETGASDEVAGVKSALANFHLSGDSSGTLRRPPSKGESAPELVSNVYMFDSHRPKGRDPRESALTVILNDYEEDLPRLQADRARTASSIPPPTRTIARRVESPRLATPNTEETRSEYPPASGRPASVSSDQKNRFVYPRLDPFVLVSHVPLPRHEPCLSSERCYGGFQVLGHLKSLIDERNSTHPGDNPNQLFSFFRRTHANGYTLQKQYEFQGPPPTQALEGRQSFTLSAPTLSFVAFFAPNVDCDSFQFGRAENNDCAFAGVQKIVSAQQSIFTVSRYSFRIVCERKPPFHTRVFAAGFDPHLRISFGPEARRTASGRDAFTTYGCLIFKPEYNQWLELSVLGGLYVVKADGTRPPAPKEFNNILTNGTVLDICGATFMWHAPIERASVKSPLPRGLAPFLRSDEPLSGHGVPHVFVGCGHVVEFPTYVNGQSQCTRCGRHLQVMPLVIAPFSPVLSGDAEVAFIPCGHVTSRSSAETWHRKIPLPLQVFNAKDRWRLAFSCPFCHFPLQEPMIQLLSS